MSVKVSLHSLAPVLEVLVDGRGLLYQEFLEFRELRGELILDSVRSIHGTGIDQQILSEGFCFYIHTFRSSKHVGRKLRVTEIFKMLERRRKSGLKENNVRDFLCIIKTMIFGFL